MRLSRTHAVVIAAGAACALLLWRAPDAFTNPQLFAEDATVFWREADRDGLAAFVTPFAGYLHLVPRLIAWVGSWFGPASAPVVYNWAALLVTAWAAATAAAAVPNLWMGVCLAVVLLLAPNPDGALLANVTHLQFVMAPVMVLLLLTPAATSPLGRSPNALFVVLAGFSGPFSVFAAPLALWRLLRHRDSLAIIVLAAASVQAVVLVLFHPPTPPADPSAVGHWLGLIVVRSLGGWSWSWPFGLGLAAIAVLARRDRKLRAGLLVFTGVLMAALFAKFLGEPIGLLDPPDNGSRYFFIQHVMFMWCAISLVFSGGWPALAGGVCAAVIIASSPKFFVRTPWPDMNWREHAVHIGKADVAIPINPSGWTLRVPADRR